MTVALETRGLCKNFGALTVADRVDFRLEAGVRHALIGPNGAGKTTFVNMITGLLAPSAGQVLLAGEDVTRLSQAARVKRGLGRTFQINTLFRDMTVLDNVALGVAERDGVGGRMWRPAGAHGRVRAEALELLATFGLQDDAGRRVLDLPYGKQRLVENTVALLEHSRYLSDSLSRYLGMTLRRAAHALSVTTDDTPQARAVRLATIAKARNVSRDIEALTASVADETSRAELTRTLRLARELRAWSKELTGGTDRG